MNKKRVYGWVAEKNALQKNKQTKTEKEVVE